MKLRLGTRILLVLLLATSAVAGCARSPGSIAPAHVPFEMYRDLSCEEARGERARITEALSALETQQRNAMVGDTIAVALIAIPVASLFGGDVSSALAVERGKLLAIDARLRNC